MSNVKPDGNFYLEPGLKGLYFFRKRLIIFVLINLIFFEFLSVINVSEVSGIIITSNCNIIANKNLTLIDYYRCLFSNDIDCFLQGNVNYYDSLKGELNLYNRLDLKKHLPHCFDNSTIGMLYHFDDNNKIQNFMVDLFLFIIIPIYSICHGFIFIC